MSGRILTLAGLVLALGGLLLPVGAMSVVERGAAPVEAGLTSRSPSGQAVTEIPRQYLRLYKDAAARYGIEWELLAGIGKVECDHGRDPSPSCTREGAVNYAGAGGPMQFLAPTFDAYGVAPFGGRPDRWNPADAIFSAANYLVASGAPADVRKAVFAYNHASSYVNQVLAWATRYRGAAAAPPRSVPGVRRWRTSTPLRYIAGSTARLAPGDGHVALIPRAAPPAVQAMLVAGNELQELPYGPQGHPNPLGAVAEDCSSTVNYVLYRAGVRPLGEILADNPLAQDYVHWGSPGPGRWVTIYAADVPTPHVFIVIAGLRLDTARAGIDLGPNREQDGPRWRLLPSIPTWATWSIRHPPGL